MWAAGIRPRAERGTYRGEPRKRGLSLSALPFRGSLRPFQIAVKAYRFVACGRYLVEGPVPSR